MARQKKNGQYLNVKIDMNVYQRLEEFCEETGYTKTAAVERALTTLMNTMKLIRRLFGELRKGQ